MSDVKIRRVDPTSEHERQKWYVLEGYVDGVPAVTKRASVAVAALVTRPGLLDEARTKLMADVAEYHANFLALEKLG